MEVEIVVHARFPGMYRREAAEAGDAAHQRIDDGLREGAGDRRIDGIAAGFSSISIPDSAASGCGQTTIACDCMLLAPVGDRKGQRRTRWRGLPHSSASATARAHVLRSISPSVTNASAAWRMAAE